MGATRREFLHKVAGLAVAAASPALAGAALLTPRQPAGPFYPVEFPLDDDNDLVQVAGHDGIARGQVTDLAGRLLDRNGRPLGGLRIEIWQCDANGRYRHPDDPRDQSIDPAFQGFGHAISDAQGRYRFRAIQPVPYPGRTPHIHVAVHTFDNAPFVTQLYVAGEPRNADDFLYRRIPVEQRERVTAAFRSVASPQAELQAQWDIVIGDV